MPLLEHFCPQCNICQYRDLWLEGESLLPAADSKVLCSGCGWQGLFSEMLDRINKISPAETRESEYILDYQI
jgi:hypothetical protein